MPSTTTTTTLCSVRSCLHDILDHLLIRVLVTVLLFVGWGWFSFLCMLSTFWEFNPNGNPPEYSRLFPVSIFLVCAILFSWILELLWWKGRQCRSSRGPRPRSTTTTTTTTTDAAVDGTMTTSSSSSSSLESSYFNCNMKQFRMSCLVVAAMIGWALFCMVAFGNEDGPLASIAMALFVISLLAGTSNHSSFSSLEQLLPASQQQQQQQQQGHYHRCCDDCCWADSGYQLLRLLGYLVLGFLLVYHIYLIMEYCGSSNGGIAVAGYVLLFSVLCLVAPTWGYGTRHTLVGAKPYPLSRAIVSTSVFFMWTWYAFKVVRYAILDDLLDGTTTDEDGTPYPFFDQFRIMAMAILLCLLVGTASFLEWLWQRPLDRWHRFRRHNQEQDENNNPEYDDNLAGCQPFCLVTGSILGWSLVCYYLMTWIFPEDCDSNEQQQQHCPTSMLYSAFRFGVWNLTALLLLIGFWPDKRDVSSIDEHQFHHHGCSHQQHVVRTFMNLLLRFICLMILFGFLLYYAYLILDEYHLHPIASWIMGILLSLASLVWGFFFRRLFLPDDNNTTSCCFGPLSATTVEMMTAPLHEEEDNDQDDGEQEILFMGQEQHDCPGGAHSMRLTPQHSLV